MKAFSGMISSHRHFFTKPEGAMFQQISYNIAKAINLRHSSSLFLCCLHAVTYSNLMENDLTRCLTELT